MYLNEGILEGRERPRVDRRRKKIRIPFLLSDTTRERREVGDTKASTTPQAVNRKGIILVRRIPFSGLPAKEEMDKYRSKI